MLNLRSKKVKAHLLVFICCIVIAGMITSGCEPLRKKFTRKKKKDKVKQEIPVLEPIEYPAKMQTSKDVYKYHFSLWQIWHKELLSGILDKKLRKRNIYFLEQAIVNLETAQGLLVPDKQEALMVYIEKMKRVERDLKSPVSRLNASSTKIKLQSIERKVRRKFSFRKVENNLKP